jgi:hypothetical protein
MRSSRRQFLRQAGLIGAASAALPLSGTINQPFDQKLIVGQGDFQYKVDKTWGNLDPMHQPVHHCHEMVLDSRKRFVCSTVATGFNVIAYNKDG